MSGFAVICDARAGERLGIGILVLVDRAKTKARWWTSDDASIAIRYEKADAAKFAAKRLRFNGARVVDFAGAAKALREQAAEILCVEALAEGEQGWDSHKDLR